MFSEEAWFFLCSEEIGGKEQEGAEKKATHSKVSCSASITVFNTANWMVCRQLSIFRASGAKPRIHWFRIPHLAPVWEEET